MYGAQAPYLQDVYSQAQNAFQQGMGQIEGLTPEVQAQLTDAFGQAAGGFGDQLGGGFASGLQGQIGPNSYVDAMKGQVADDAMRLKQQNLGSLDARAAAAGMSGSSGYRDQVNDMSNQIDENALNQMSQIGYNAHNQGIQNQMQLAGMMDQNQQAGLGNLQSNSAGCYGSSSIQRCLVSRWQGSTPRHRRPTVLGSSSGGSTNQSTSMNQGTSFKSRHLW